MKGVDISHWQGSIDWKKVNDEAKYAIIKCSEGVGYVDPTFTKNKAGARDADLVVGFYHFARGNDAVKEADFFLKSVGDIREGEFLVLDWEIQHSNPVSWCKTFLDRVTEKVGFKPMIYINSATAKAFNWKPVIDASYGLWIAAYGPNNGQMNGDPAIGGWPFAAIWQYTSRGRISGISGNVDLNWAYMNIETLKKYGKPKEAAAIDYKKLYEEEKEVSKTRLSRIDELVKEKDQFKRSSEIFEKKYKDIQEIIGKVREIIK